MGKVVEIRKTEMDVLEVELFLNDELMDKIVISPYIADALARYFAANKNEEVAE